MIVITIIEVTTTNVTVILTVMNKGVLQIIMLLHIVVLLSS